MHVAICTRHGKLSGTRDTKSDPETLKQRSKMIVPKLDFTLEPFLAFDTKIHFVIAARIGAQA